MGLATFKGGVHPFEGKELSADKPIQVLEPTGDMVYPMSQHIGEPAKPIVAKGDQVLVGQKLGEAQGFISAHVISSVSGTVKAIESRRVASGDMVSSVIIENDGQYQTIEGYGEKRDVTKLSKEEIRTIIKEAGIVGLGGAGFPTHVKLTPKEDDKIDYILVNGAECEPYLTSDYRLMLEQPEKIVGGLKVILQLFKNAKGVIAVEDNKPAAIAKLTELAAAEEKIEVCTVKTKYPQGGERPLIFAVTGRKVHAEILPPDVGCIVDNVDTVISIYNAVCETTPLIRRVVTITGDAVATPGNFCVKTGTNYQQLIDAAGGFKEEPEKVISGGPMMGQALFDLNIPVTKVSSALTCFTVDEVAAYAPSACIRCGKCIEVCACRIVPQMMMEAAEQSNLERFEKLGGMECVECGTCGYICPARRPLTQAFKEAKRAVRENRKKA